MMIRTTARLALIMVADRAALDSLAHVWRQADEMTRWRLPRIAITRSDTTSSASTSRQQARSWRYYDLRWIHHRRNRHRRRWMTTASTIPPAERPAPTPTDPLCALIAPHAMVTALAAR